MTEPAAPPADREPPTEAQIAERLFGPKPADAPLPAPVIAEPTREEQMADALYGNPESTAKAYGPDLDESLKAFTGLLPEPITDERRAEILEQTSQFYYDAGISPSAASVLNTTIVNVLKSPPVDEATDKQWETESTDWLKRAYPDGHQRQLAQVKAFVEARPEFKNLLNQYRLGNHPAVVRALVENYGRLRIKPHAKKK